MRFLGIFTGRKVGPRPTRRGSRRRGCVAPERLESRIALSANPVANPDLFLTTVGTAIDVSDLLANDAATPGHLLSLSRVQQPSYGSVVVGSGGNYTYLPGPAFTGIDSFSYDVEDTAGGTATGTVSIAVNAALDVEAARDAILAGVTSLANPVQPGHMVVYGPTAASIANYAGQGLADPMIAAATLGTGRVIAVPDHQWLQMGRFSGDESTETFFRNGIDWLAGTTARDVGIVVYDAASQTWADATAEWLANQGYTDVTIATSATLATDLQGADVLIASWLGVAPTEGMLAAVRDFTIGGGGLFIGEYGIGHEWWWGNGAADVPGNKLLREAGIGFSVEWPHGGTSWPIERAIGQVTTDTILAVLDRASTLDEAGQLEALGVYARLARVLAPADTQASRLATAFTEWTASIYATPATPVTDPIEQVLLQIEADMLAALPASDLTAHRTAAAVYGEIPADTPRLAGHVVTIDGTKTGWVATGVYAPPGERVTVTVPAALVGRDFSIRLGGHTDNISARESWDRMPRGISRSYPIDATEVVVAGAFGGAIYIDFGGKSSGTSPDLGPVVMTIDGGIAAPLFVLGQTSNADWIAGIRDNPAPYAELVSDRAAFSVPSAWIRSLDDPATVMAAWDDAIAFQDWVGGVESLRTGPERFNVDVQISSGWLHSGYPMQGPVAYGGGFLDPAVLFTSGDWGLFHEFGHEHQRQSTLGWSYTSNPWTFDGDVEVTVNIFANAAFERMTPLARSGDMAWSNHPEEVMRRAMEEVADAAHPSFDDKDVYPFYYQLADGPWGWQGYRDVLSGYVADAGNDPATLPATNQAKKDQWLVRWSQATGFDMRAYMVGQWGLEVSQEAIDAVAAMNLPSWLPLATATAGVWFDGRGSVTFDLAAAGLGVDGVATLVAVGEPSHGTLASGLDGRLTYTPGPSFHGADAFPATFESSAGNRQTFTIAVTADGAWLETYTGLGGVAVADLVAAPAFPGSPTTAFGLSSLEAPRNAADNFGQRLRARIRPPVTGDYTFWIASDDHGELLLSTDADPANAVRIAGVPGFTAPREWTKYPEQRSGMVRLEAGQSYYLEALAKEGAGGDHLAVAWAQPGSAEPTVIGGEALAFNVRPTAPALSAAFVMENRPAGTVVGELSATDFDSGDVVSFSIVPGPGSAAFGIDGNRLVTRSPLNAERQAVYRITVRATDAGGLSSEDTFDIGVGDELVEPFVVETLVPPAAGLLRAGQFVEFTLVTSTAAIVRSRPRVPIRIGGITRLATYVRGSGTTDLTFRYRVVAGDNGPVSLGGRFILPPGAAIVSAGRRIPVILPQAGAAFPDLLVDTRRPRSVGRLLVPPAGTYGVEATLRFTVRFSEVVHVAGTPRLGLVINAVAGGRQATYVSGSGTNELVFEYAVRRGDLTPRARGIVVAPRLTLPAGSRITDVAGNLAVASLLLPPTRGIRVDGRLGSG
jgi:hypothetical protein